MKSLAKLKDDARRHEQREEWQDAINLYLRVLRSAEEGETELELPLYNRIGDLFVRLGRPAEAVRHYEQAADKYAEAGLYNNAIALCNKALRYLPDRLELFRKLGRFSASQGFLTDARHWFLEYAERMFARGDLDKAFAALEDFADVTDDPAVRADFARQLAAHDRPASAIEEFRRAHAGLVQAGDGEAAERLRDEVRTLLPDAGDIADHADFESRRSAGPEAEALPGYGEPAPDALPATVDETAADEPHDETTEPQSADGHLSGFEATVTPADIAAEAPLEGFESTSMAGDEMGGAGPTETVDEIEGFDTGRADDDSAPEPLPLLDDGQPEPAAAGEDEVTVRYTEDLDPGEDEATPLPLIDAPAADERHAADDLYGVGTVDASSPPPPLPPLPSFDPEPTQEQPEPADERSAPSAEESTATDEQTVWSEDRPQPTDEPPTPTEDRAPWSEAEPQPADEPSMSTERQTERSEASLQPTDEPLQPTDEPPEPTDEQPETSAESMPLSGGARLAGSTGEPRPWESAPDGVTSGGSTTRDEYVDLFALINPDEDRVIATRFFVEEKQPTGDEDRDFAEMLAEFKAKVAEHVGEHDSGSHYDLGLAFKEMGLIDEAIGEFQVSLRAGANRLKVFEELGQCFILKRQPTIAVKVLARALQIEHRDELEMIGVYYHLGRAFEELGQSNEARDAYERVLGLDIGFKDVTDRVSRL